MSTVRIPQAPRLIVVLSEEEGGISAVGRVAIKQLVDRSQELLRLVPGNDTLTAQIRLQIRHQESARDSLPCDVAEHKPDPFLAKIEEVVVVAADLTSLYADPGVVERLECGKDLRKEACLHLFGDYQLMGG